MKKWLRKGISTATSAAIAIAAIPFSMFSAMAEDDDIPVSPLQNVVADYAFGDDVYYMYNGVDIYADSDLLGFTVVPDDLAGYGGAGSGNETGILPFSTRISQDEDGKIHAKEIGTYSLTAKLKDGYKWDTIGGEYGDAAITFEVAKIKIEKPEPVQETFVYDGKEHKFEFKSALPEVCEIDEKYSVCSATDIDDYRVVIKLKDTENYRFTENGYDVGNDEISYTFSITKCVHSEYGYDNGYCKNCGMPKEPESVNGVYKISNAGELEWYLTNPVIKSGYGCYEYQSAELTNDIVFNENVLDKNYELKNDISNYRLINNAFDVTQLKTDDENNGIANFNGNGHIIKGLCAENTLFNYVYSGSTVKNLGLVDCYFKNGPAIAGNNSGIIENCFVSAETKYSGLSYANWQEEGNENSAIIRNCYFTGKINDGNNKNNAFYFDNEHKGVLTNCYCLEGFGTGDGISTFKAEELSSGALAYEMNVAADEIIWYQNLDNGKAFDSMPVPNDSHGMVYQCKDCKKVSDAYTNDEDAESTHVGMDDGICDVCGEPEVPEYKDEVYQLSKAGHLCWFAGLVNGTLKGVEKNNSANAVLTADITFNENLLDDDGKLSGDNFNKLEPIKEYSGKFNGNGHIITGLYIDALNREYVGMFETLSGTVENLILNEAYIFDKIDDEGISTGKCGGIAVKVEKDGTIKNCAFIGTIKTVGEHDFEIRPLVCENSGELLNCFSLTKINDKNPELSGSPVTFDDKSALSDGTLAYYLGSDWGQKIGEDAFPKINGETVYKIEISSEEDVPDAIYTNGSTAGLDDIVKGLDSKYQYTVIDIATKAKPASVISGDIKVEIAKVIEEIKLSVTKSKSISGKVGESISNNLSDYVANADKVGSLAFAVADGSSLPSGLNLSNGLIYGTPSKAGTFSTTFKITAGNGKTSELTLNFRIAKGTAPPIPSTTIKPIEFGAKLSDIQFTNGWAWENGDIKPTVVNNGYNLCYPVTNDADYDYSEISGYNAETHKIVRKVPVTVTVSKVYLDGATATLGGDIGMNFFMAFPESIKSDTGSRVMINNEEYDLASAKISDGRYKFTYWLNAKEMHDNLTISVVSGEGVKQDLYASEGSVLLGDTFDYSVAEYLKNINEGSENLKALVKDMLTYGTYAQLHFGYDTASAENIDTADLSAVTKENVVSYKAESEGKAPEGVKIQSMSLLLKSETSMRIYFTAEGDVSDYTFKLDGKTANVTKDKTKGRYYIEVSSVAANNLAESHKLTVGEYTLTFSPMSYVYNVLSGEGYEESLVNVVKALYKYWESACKYASEQ